MTASTASRIPRKQHLANPGRARIGRVMTLFGYFGLLALILNWFIWIAPPETMPRAFPIIALAVPLLFPLRGLLHGRRYTHLWAGFLSLLYFTLGIDAWYNAAAGTAWLGAMTVLFSVLLFVGTIVFARYTATGGPSAAAAAEAEFEARAAAAAADGSGQGQGQDEP